MDEFLSVGVMATHVGGRVQSFHLVRLCNLGKIPFRKIGRTRVIKSADLEEVRRACRAMGYLKDEVTHAKA